MFDDPSLEIDELTGIIKQDIQGLNAAIGELQRISTKKPDESKQAVDHSHTVVDNLRTRLKDATQEFRDVLTMRTDNLKLHQERRQLFSSQPDMRKCLSSGCATTAGLCTAVVMRMPADTFLTCRYAGENTIAQPT